MATDGWALPRERALIEAAIKQPNVRLVSRHLVSAPTREAASALAPVHQAVVDVEVQCLRLDTWLRDAGWTCAIDANIKEMQEALIQAGAFMASVLEPLVGAAAAAAADHDFADGPPVQPLSHHTISIVLQGLCKVYDNLIMAKHRWEHCCGFADAQVQVKAPAKQGPIRYHHQQKQQSFNRYRLQPQKAYGHKQSPRVEPSPASSSPGLSPKAATSAAVLSTMLSSSSSSSSSMSVGASSMTTGSTSSSTGSRLSPHAAAFVMRTPAAPVAAPEAAPASVIKPALQVAPAANATLQQQQWKQQQQQPIPASTKSTPLTLVAPPAAAAAAGGAAATTANNTMAAAAATAAVGPHKEDHKRRRPSHNTTKGPSRNSSSSSSPKSLTSPTSSHKSTSFGSSKQHSPRQITGQHLWRALAGPTLTTLASKGQQQQPPGTTTTTGSTTSPRTTNTGTATKNYGKGDYQRRQPCLRPAGSLKCAGSSSSSSWPW